MDDHHRNDGAAGGTDPGALPEIRAFLGRLLDAWGLEVEADVFVEGDALVVQLEGPDEELLLERRGEVLHALQVILGKAFPRRFGTQLRVLVDSGGYRLGREREIVEVARLTAEKVKKLGKPLDLSPMNAYERRIVHLTLSSDTAVRTESDGEGPVRRVRILPGRPPG
jgi:spoIIIJ-associated protein